VSARLFEPLTIRDITLRNRIAVSPMCQYSSEDGFAHDWHLVHLGSRAVGGAGLVMTEAAAVEPRGRISPWDLGIWKDEHVEFLARIVRFIRIQGAAAGIQLAHAGRKASVKRPWEGAARIPESEGGWAPQDPSTMTVDEIRATVAAFRDAARRALEAEFDVVEIHGAHGYLIHSFLSPLSNQRTDAYADRLRFALEVVDAVREVWPDRLPLFMRISATDWIEGGWTVDDSVDLSRRLKDHGVDLIDCSSGGLAPQQKIPVAPGYRYHSPSESGGRRACSREPSA
jgi:2,4-dienoyl-CoA reductase-like NADH-dependent reductase (Old Yellow Enzyme family)